MEYQISEANTVDTFEDLMSKEVVFRINIRRSPGDRIVEATFRVRFTKMLSLKLSNLLKNDRELMRAIYSSTIDWLEEHLMGKTVQIGDVINYPYELTYAVLEKKDPNIICLPLKEWKAIDLSNAKNHIFISCGQSFTETVLGKKIVHLIEDVTPYDGYFAENQSDNDAIINNIYKKLRRPAACIVVLHDRGQVSDIRIDGVFHRGSVWCEQEIAIIAFQIIFGYKIPLKIYAEKNIKLEGLREVLPKTIYFEADQEVIEDLKAWLPTLPQPPSSAPDNSENIDKYVDKAVDHWKENGQPYGYLKSISLPLCQRLEVYKMAYQRRKSSRPPDLDKVRDELGII